MIYFDHKKQYINTGFVAKTKDEVAEQYIVLQDTSCLRLHWATCQQPLLHAYIRLFRGFFLLVTIVFYVVIHNMQFLFTHSLLFKFIESVNWFKNMFDMQF